MCRCGSYLTGLRGSTGAHPEGGWFRRHGGSEVRIPESVLPWLCAARIAGTAILFALMPNQHSGAAYGAQRRDLVSPSRQPAVVEVGADRGTAETSILGPDIAAGQQPQVLVPAGHTGSAPGPPATSRAW